MRKKSKLPRINRVAFYRLTDSEFIDAFGEAMTAAVAEKTPIENEHAAVAIWGRLTNNVANGGLVQFFYNNQGDVGVKETATLLGTLGEEKAANILRDAIKVYRQNKKKFATENPWDGLFGSIKELEKLSRAFMQQSLKGTRALEKWVRENIQKLAVGDDGEPIDATFTGAVETKQANGLVGEYLEVKKGKPSGAYREFFDDGSARQVIFYKNGKISGDFWPSGQLKKKESKREAETVIEWYYPSGKLQKRYVHSKKGHVVEPIRLYHENGQLAEELSMEKEKKKGPWVKFFEDGSPRLQAEHGEDEKLIVRNAWDDTRQQTVKEGTGTYAEDRRWINCESALWFEGSLSKVLELKDGVPHGKVVIYDDGVVYRVDEFRNGVQEGESKTYWDNGRLQSVERYKKGKPDGKRQEFPKFDKPVPAVILNVEADEKLYAAWIHNRMEHVILLDEYPRVLNIDEVRKQLKVPKFLQEVHERNLAGLINLDDDLEYENANRFNDCIAYFLKVDENGVVTDAHANGSNAYSGSEWGTYVELLKQLRFSPGRIRGRAVACRVLANVCHTFVEGQSQGK